MSESENLSVFECLADAFLKLGALRSPSQLQGYLSGQLAVGWPPAIELWPEQACSFIDCANELEPTERGLLEALLSDTAKTLAAEAMDFQLLLPDEDTELSLRVDCLGQWCQGFLAGFALGGKQRQAGEGAREYSEELSEMLNDLAAISQVDVDEQFMEEQGEQDFFELVEYLRVAAISIFLECNGESPQAKTPDLSDNIGPLH